MGRRTEIQRGWNVEILRRLEEVRDGSAELVDARESVAQARALIEAARAGHKGRMERRRRVGTDASNEGEETAAGAKGAEVVNGD